MNIVVRFLNELLSFLGADLGSRIADLFLANQSLARVIKMLFPGKNNQENGVGVSWRCQPTPFADVSFIAKHQIFKHSFEYRSFRQMNYRITASSKRFVFTALLLGIVCCDASIACITGSHGHPYRPE